MASKELRYIYIFDDREWVTRNKPLLDWLNEHESEIDFDRHLRPIFERATLEEMREGFRDLLKEMNEPLADALVAQVVKHDEAA
jgi:hypothetical protein